MRSVIDPAGPLGPLVIQAATLVASLGSITTSVPVVSVNGDLVFTLSKNNSGRVKNFPVFGLVTLLRLVAGICGAPRFSSVSMLSSRLEYHAFAFL